MKDTSDNSEVIHPTLHHYGGWELEPYRNRWDLLAKALDEGRSSEDSPNEALQPTPAKGASAAERRSR